MQKFTVFTVLLTIVVVVVAAETFVNKYLPALGSDRTGVVEEEGYNLPSELELSDTFKSSVLGADLIGAPENTVPADEVPDVMDMGAVDMGVVDMGVVDTGVVDMALPLGLVDTSGSDSFDFMNTDGFGSADDGLLDVADDGSFDLEDFSMSYDGGVGPISYLRNDQVTNSGFVGAYVVDEDHEGLIYKAISISDLIGITVKKFAVTNGTTTYAKVYVIVPDNPAQTGEVYEVIKVRGGESSQMSVNETNQYGSASFYLNDARRDGVAFLTVRIGSKVYGFSYPKQYHPQIRNLISNLMLGN